LPWCPFRGRSLFRGRQRLVCSILLRCRNRPLNSHLAGITRYRLKLRTDRRASCIQTSFLQSERWQIGTGPHFQRSRTGGSVPFLTEHGLI
jgi:hypothetical protein